MVIYKDQVVACHFMEEQFNTARNIEPWMTGSMLELENWITHFKGIYITYVMGLPLKIQTKYKVPFVVTKSSQRKYTLWKPKFWRS